MTVRVCQQNREIKKKFYDSIKQKIDQKASNNAGEIGNYINRSLGFGGEFFKQIFELGYKVNNSIDKFKGDIGEGLVKFVLTNSRTLRTNETVIINDAVLEIEQNQFIQIDHIIISENGVFLVETKNWQGAYTGYRDKWRVKTSKGWEECASPTRQHQRHEYLFKKWLKRNLQDSYFEDNYIRSIVVIFTSWMKASKCSVEVVKGYGDLMNFIEFFDKKVLDGNLINRITELIVNAPTIQESHQTSEEKPKLPQILGSGTGRDGTKYVRVKGSKEEASIIAKTYEDKGFKVSDIQTDKYDEGIKYFYIK